MHAPTAMHLEPWAFVGVQDRVVLRRVSDRAKLMMQDAALAHRDLLRAPGAAVCAAVVQTTADGDPGTADLFTEISRAVDKLLWFVESHAA